MQRFSHSLKPKVLLLNGSGTPGANAYKRMKPFFLDYSAQKSVGTSFLVIMILSVSVLLAHNKLSNVDYRAGLLLWVGAIIGAQIGAHLIEHITTISFKKIFAMVLLGLSAYLLFKK